MLKKSLGFTVTELMIGLTLGALLLAGLVSIFDVTIKHSNRSLKRSMLHNQLEIAMQIMITQIKRAGYWGNARSDVNTSTNNNPFMISGTDIQTNAGNDCILFSYDANGDGSIAAVNNGSDDERYGFRLINNRLQSRPVSAAFSCTDAANAWDDLVDANLISITNLSFTRNIKNVDLDGAGSGTATIQVRTIDISMTGQLVDDPTVSETLQQSVRVRNDKFVP